MRIFGTKNDDFLFVRDGIDRVFAKKGDDHIALDETRNDVKVRGGEGNDVFEFQLMSGQAMSIKDINDHKTVIKIFDDAGDRVQKIVLFDVEQIDWYMLG